jgi:cytochrome c
MEMQMSPKIKARTKILIGAFAGAVVLSFSASAFAEDAMAMKVDAVAAKKLARKDSCLRCHDVSRKKEGPSYQSIAYKYKGKADAADMLVKHITAGEDRVKLSDGHEEIHKFIKTTDMDQIKNMVNWILAQ